MLSYIMIRKVKFSLYSLVVQAEMRAKLNFPVYRNVMFLSSWKWIHNLQNQPVLSTATKKFLVTLSETDVSI